MSVEKLSRRKFFTDAGKVAAGAALGAGFLLGSRSGITGRAEEAPEWPWPYVELDLDAVAQRGYDGYYEHHCAYGAFEAIVGELRERIGSPFTLMPTELMVYGAGGVAGWGSLCGGLNGACAAITLVAQDYKPLVHELTGWYTETPIPPYKPANPKVEIPGEPTSISGSTLCHVSVTNWCKASGFASGSKERSERCARLTGQVAAKAAELLNKYHAGEFTPEFTLPAATEGCRTCHFKGPDYEAGQFTRGKENCVQCHGNPHQS